MAERIGRIATLVAGAELFAAACAAPKPTQPEQTILPSAPIVSPSIASTDIPSPNVATFKDQVWEIDQQLEGTAYYRFLRDQINRIDLSPTMVRTYSSSPAEGQDGMSVNRTLATARYFLSKLGNIVPQFEINRVTPEEVVWQRIPASNEADGRFITSGRFSLPRLVSNEPGFSFSVDTVYSALGEELQTQVTIFQPGSNAVPLITPMDAMTMEDVQQYTQRGLNLPETGVAFEVVTAPAFPNDPPGTIGEQFLRGQYRESDGTTVRFLTTIDGAIELTSTSSQPNS